MPFGRAYLAVFLAKMVLTLAMLATTVALGLLLHRAYGRSVPAIAGGSDEAYNVL